MDCKGVEESRMMEIFGSNVMNMYNCQNSTNCISYVDVVYCT